MEKDTCVFCHQLLKTHVLLILITAVRTAPVANSSTLDHESLTNLTDSAEQIKHELEWNKAAKAVGKEELQILDHLIIDDAVRRLSSGTNLTETSPTIEDVVPGRLMFEEVTQASKGLGTTSDTVDAAMIQVRQRLQKLDFYFDFLRVMSEDCRQRMLCEVTRDAERFYPLSSVFEEATSFAESHQYLTSQLVNTTEGARLLSYLEASFRGQERARTCAVFQYRCPSRTEEMINYDALCLWREMVHWLTVHVVARVH